MKKLLIGATLWLMACVPGFAQSSYTALDSTGHTITFHTFNCSSTICPGSTPMDQSGNPLGTPGNPLYANPTNGSSYQNTSNWTSGVGSQTGTSATTILTAPGASIRTFVTAVQCSRDDAGTTAVRVTLNDISSTPILLPNNGGGGGNNMTFPTPLIVTAATALTFTPSSAVTTIRCSAQGYHAS